MRSSIRRLLFLTVAAGAVAAAACTDAPPAAPVAAVPSLSSGSGSGDGAGRELLERQADEARARLRAEKDRSRAAYDSLKAVWDRQRKRTSTSDVQLLACEPEEFAYDVEIVGPDGGTLQMGRHRLEIPPGALDSLVVIEAVAPLSPVREVRFAPHGLQFHKSGRLDVSYHGCTEPAGFRGQMAYVDDEYRILELPKTEPNDASLEMLRSWIDHFSGYVVAHTRIAE